MQKCASFDNFMPINLYPILFDLMHVLSSFSSFDATVPFHSDHHTCETLKERNQVSIFQNNRGQFLKGASKLLMNRIFPCGLTFITLCRISSYISLFIKIFHGYTEELSLPPKPANKGNRGAPEECFTTAHSESKQKNHAKDKQRPKPAECDFTSVGF